MEFKPPHDFVLIGMTGLAALTVGLWLVYPPLAWIVDGLIMIGVGLLLGRGRQ